MSAQNAPTGDAWVLWRYITKGGLLTAVTVIGAVVWGYRDLQDDVRSALDASQAVTMALEAERQQRTHVDDKLWRRIEAFDGAFATLNARLARIEGHTQAIEKQQDRIYQAITKPD